ncbi:hypothetical protein [Microlunatus soli]|uniref:DUF998 domain-containing protein n=1 Tax=Microlunatus soli TaxID=630515 RepID=A0A1H1Z4K8_9ACTN|nr:hypothetical protein [Microlunatus soli]SDT28116.1 hypothetical protein SAMN04489812_4950 [Microlunatus soli]
MKTRFAPVIMLAVVSPLTAEFLLGDQYLQGFAPAPAQIVMFLAFVAFYGMAAVLIRELGRRLRVGWPGLLLLALGYGIVEEGLITQTLFNPHYLGLDLLAPGHIDALGMGAPWTVFVISLHVVWSIGTPIAITEAWYGSRRHDGDGAPDTGSWLGPVGIVVCALVLLIGVAGTFVESTLASATPFLAQPAQLIGAAVAAAAAVLGAIALRGRDHSVLDGSPTASVSGGPTLRQVLLGALFGVLATSIFHAADKLPDRLGWVSFAVMLVVWLIALLIMSRWRPAPFGVATGAVLSYAWVGMLPAIRTGTVGAVIEQSVLIIGYLVLLSWIIRRLGRDRARPASYRAAGERPARR